MFMNPYILLASRLGTAAAAALSVRLSAWHDAMVAHERRLGSGGAGGCGDECPHAEARELWLEVLSTFGSRAHELAFLRSRANRARPRPGESGAAAR
jgi:hypothetical protein